MAPKNADAPAAGDGSWRTARRSGPWNKFSEAAVTDILSAARAAGASYVVVRYGETECKVAWDRLAEEPEVTSARKELQLNEVRQRTEQLARRDANAERRKQKERERKKKQKIAKQLKQKAEAAGDEPHAAPAAAASTKEAPQEAAPMDQTPTTILAGAFEFGTQAPRTPSAATHTHTTQAARAHTGDGADELGESACVETGVVMVKAALSGALGLFGDRTTKVRATKAPFGAPGDIPAVMIEAAAGSPATTMHSTELYASLTKLGRDKLMGNTATAQAEARRLVAKAGK